MGSRSAGWNLKKCIMRYSQKRLRTLTCRRKRGGCIYYTGDFSSEISAEFRPTSKRPFTPELSVNKQFRDSLNSSTLSAAAEAAFTPPKEDECACELEKAAEIVPQHESPKETCEPLVAMGHQVLGGDHMQPQAEAHDPPKDPETLKALSLEESKEGPGTSSSMVVDALEISTVRALQPESWEPETEARTANHQYLVQEGSHKPTIVPELKTRIQKPGMRTYMVHISDISTVLRPQPESCEPETEARTADHEDQERSHKPAIAPEPKKGILKPGISLVHESAVPIDYMPHSAPESEARTAEESDSPCDHPPETHADGDCRSRGLEAQQKNTSALISASPRSASDVGRSFGLIKVPQSRGGSPWSPPRAAATAGSSWTATPQLQTCSQCQNAHNLGKPPRLLKADQIKRATNNFCKKNFLDNGDCEFVYKGCLDGEPVAIKTVRHENYIDKFSAEIAVLSSLQHPNVVSLVGYCLEENDRALVYNYACNRSLFWHLCSISNGTKLMPWTVRKDLAINLARGLHYLHSECRGGGIIHGDFRSRNVFLNHDMVPMIGGFGQSRLQESGLIPLTSRPQKGYRGYVAPEYLEAGQISEKVDVYAFGIVLLELITGRGAVDRSRPQEQRDLVDWARPWLESPTDYDKMKNEMLDAQLMENGQECTEAEVLSTIHAARLCLRKDPLMRPPMNQVLDILANSDNDDFQDRACPSFVKVSTAADRNEIAGATVNRSTQSAALGLATLRAAADPAETPSSLAPSRPLDDLELEDMEFRCAPSTPNLNELVRRDRDFARSTRPWPGRYRPGAAGSWKGTGKVTQLLYQPLHYLTNSSYNRSTHRVSFKKGTTPTRRGYLWKSLFHLLNYSSTKAVMTFKGKLQKELIVRRSHPDWARLGWKNNQPQGIDSKHPIRSMTKSAYSQ